MSDIIEWHQAEQMPEENNRRQQEAVSLFLEENCETYNGRDLQYWKDRTGKTVAWILENGQNIHPTLKEVVRMSANNPDNYSFDDVWDFIAPYEDDSDDETSVEWQPSQEVLNIFRNTINR